MKKRLFLIGVAALATTLATVGCGGDEGSMDIGDDGEITFRNVNISFQHVITGTDNTYLTNLVNEFNKEHQGQIRVQAAPVQAADIYGNLPLTTSNNRNSDVMLIHAERVLQFAAQEEDGSSRYFRELDDIMELAQVELDPNDFPADVWDNMQFNGEQYGIPFDMHMAGIYVNTSMLKELGLEMPETREDIIAAAQAAIKAGYQGFPISNGYPDTYFFINAFLNNGGKQMLQEGDEGFDPNQKLSDGTVVPYQPGAYYNDAAFKAGDSIRDLMYGTNKISEPQLQTDAGISQFRSGNALFTCDGIWLLNDVIEDAKDEFEFDVLPMSTLFNSTANSGYKGVNYTNGHIFVLPKHTLGGETKTRQQASMYFVKWMLEHSADWAASGKIPAYAPAREEEAFTKLPYLDGFGEIDSFVAMQASPYTYSAFSPLQQVTTAVMNANHELSNDELNTYVDKYYQEGINLVKADMSGGSI